MKPDSTNKLRDIMARLRAPDSGCPWDLEQTFRTIAPHTIEEAYEVADAIERDDLEDLRDELGDLLFQVIFYAQMAEEQNAFDYDEIVDRICEKMIRRHPHVFGEAIIKTATAQTDSWETMKAKERASKGGNQNQGVLSGIAQSLPAMTRALKLQNRAARVGFDWPVIEQVLEKLDEEVAELKDAITANESKDRLSEELGDVLFVCANIARHLEIEPESALRNTNRKFEKRFGYIEEELKKRGVRPDEASLDEMETLWQAAKQKRK